MGSGLFRDGKELTDDVLKNLESLHIPDDKAFGWPAWIQDIECPVCPCCKIPMELLYQLQDGLHLNLGLKGGKAFLFWCRMEKTGTLLCQP